MTKRWLLLIADDPFEERVIANFLEAVDYEVKTSRILSEHGASQQAAKFDAGVWVAQNRESEVAATIESIRKGAQNESLPIVAVLTQHPDEPRRGVSVLLRPIRLFDLVNAVDKVVAESPGGAAQDVDGKHVNPI